MKTKEISRISTPKSDVQKKQPLPTVVSLQPREGFNGNVTQVLLKCMSSALAPALPLPGG